MIIIDKIYRQHIDAIGNPVTVLLDNVQYSKDIFYKYCRGDSPDSFDYRNFHRALIDLYDTEKNQYQIDQKLYDIKDKLKKIFGIFEVDETYLMLPLSVDAWNLLDFIDEEIKEEQYRGRPDQFIKNKYKDSIWIDERERCCLFRQNEKQIVVVDMSSGLYPIDEYKLFWSTHGNHFTILSLYKIAFEYASDFIIKSDSIVYIHSDDLYFELEINSMVIRFITKLKVLKK